MRDLPVGSGYNIITTYYVVRAELIYQVENDILTQWLCKFRGNFRIKRFNA